MSHLEGDRTPEMRKGRVRLSVRSPHIELALASLNIDQTSIEDTRTFGNKLVAAVARWRVGREVFTAERKLSKADADRLLRARLRDQWNGGGK